MENNTVENIINELRKFSDTNQGDEKTKEIFMEVFSLWMRGVSTNILEKLPAERRQAFVDMAKNVETADEAGMQGITNEMKTFLAVDNITPEHIDAIVLEEGNRLVQRLTA
jgi:hypothetical protein